MNTNWQKEFARLLPSVESPPSPDAAAVGHMMREWLQGVVADSGTHVDTGGGLGCYDLWAKVGGKELFISIKERAQ